MKITALLALSSLILIIGCGKKDDDKGDKKKDVDAVNVTDTSMCRGNSPMGISIFGGSWKLQHAIGNIHLTQLFNFAQTEVSIIQTCELNKSQVSVEVRANAFVDAFSFQVFSNDEKSAEVTTADGSTLTCNASISTTSQAINYGFQGPCLKVVLPDGTTQLMPPAL